MSGHFLFLFLIIIFLNALVPPRSVYKQAVLCSQLCSSASRKEASVWLWRAVSTRDRSLFSEGLASVALLCRMCIQWSRVALYMLISFFPFPFHFQAQELYLDICSTLDPPRERNSGARSVSSHSSRKSSHTALSDSACESSPVSESANSLHSRSICTKLLHPYEFHDCQWD